MNQSTFQRAAILAFSIALIALADLDRGYAKEQDDLQFAAPVSPKKSVRFYKVNKELQGDRIMLTPKKAASPGCQNFLKSVRVHRAVQTGYTACLLYAEKDCNDDSIINVASEKDPGRTYFLTEGVGWMPQSDEPRGVKLGSWNCGLSVEPTRLADEAALAASEVKRLVKIAGKTAERAAIAQQKAAQAQKNADKVKQRSKLARKRAIAAGVLLPDKKVNIGEDVSKDEEAVKGDEGDEGDETEE